MKEAPEAAELSAEQMQTFESGDLDEIERMMNDLYEQPVKSRGIKTLEAIVSAISIPLVILNIFGGLVSGIWLLVLRQWSPMLSGLFCFFASTFLVSLLLMPGLLFSLPAAYLAEKGKKIFATIFLILSGVYSTALVAVWCCAVLIYFTQLANDASLIPVLIWSYGVAIGPWQYLMSKDPENFASAISTFFAQLAYVTAILLVLFTPISILGVVITFAGFMTVATVLSLIVGTTALKYT